MSPSKRLRTEHGSSDAIFYAEIRVHRLMQHTQQALLQLVVLQNVLVGARAETDVLRAERDALKEDLS